MTLSQWDSSERRSDAPPARRSTLRRRALAVAVSGILAASFAAFSTVASSDPPANDLVIEALSTHVDRVSGGDFLVKLTYTRVRQVLPLWITLNDQNVNGATFRPGTEPNTLVGLVTGLELGPNVLRVRGKSSSGIRDQSLQLTNYSIKGPIISGPQIHLWPAKTRSRVSLTLVTWPSNMIRAIGT